MRVKIAEIDKDPSLIAMWHAFERSQLVRIQNNPEIALCTRNESLDLNGEDLFCLTETGAGVGSPIYIGQQYDPESSLSYLNARYYDGGRGQFLSEDPVFLGNPSSQVITDPQSLNAYAYSEDNPITKKDPTGKAFGADDAGGIIGGALVGAGVEAVTNVVTHQQITAGGLVGAAVNGAIVGEGIVNSPETGGASILIAAGAGGLGGTAGNYVKQQINILTGSQKSSLNYGEIATSGIIGTFFGGVVQGGVPAIAGIANVAFKTGLNESVDTALNSFTNSLLSQSKESARTVVNAAFTYEATSKNK